MKPVRRKTLLSFLLAMIVAIPAWAVESSAPDQAASVRVAVPGSINYVEGEVTVGDQPITKDSIGTVELTPGQLLTTSAGKAEVLLGPGVILRVGDNSMARMLSPNPADVELVQGQATVEVLLHNPGMVLIHQSGATTRPVKNGLYEFDAERGAVYVYKGQAMVEDRGKTVKVKGGRVLNLNASDLKTAKFDKKAFENSDLVQFSGMRSEYLAEANANAAHAYYMSNVGWYGPGWYWDPDFYAYTWVPADDYFYDPFGWGFYSPAWVVDSPFLFVGFFGDFDDHSFGHHHHGRHRLPESFSAREHGFNHNHEGARAPAMAGRPAFNAGAAHGFNSAPAVHAPAFNRGGMAGGFHGGGMGGGFHGGGGGAMHAPSGGFGGGHVGGFGGGFGGVHR